MPCTGCSRQFSLFAKEYGCSECGFSHCSKCLKDGKCRACLLSKSSAMVANIAPIVVQRQLETLENPCAAPIVIYKEPSRYSRLKRGLSEEDSKLVDRLAKLKSETRQLADIPSQQEIEERLARLRGVDAGRPRGDGAAEDEQIAARLYRLRNEGKAQIPTEDEIAARLAKIRDQDPPQPQTSISGLDPVTSLIRQAEEEARIGQKMLPSNDVCDPEELLRKVCAEEKARAVLHDEDLKRRMHRLGIGEAICDTDEDDEMQASQLVAKLTEEVRLGVDEDSVSSDGEPQENELPWCELCNGDAELRCSGCDGDLYCRRCWREVHCDAENRNHQTQPFNPASHS